MQGSLTITFIVNTFDISRELDCIYLNYKKACHTCLILATECTAVALRRSFNFFNWSLGRCDVPVSFLIKFYVLYIKKVRKTIYCSLFQRLLQCSKLTKRIKQLAGLSHIHFGYISEKRDCPQILTVEMLILTYLYSHSYSFLYLVIYLTSSL